MCLKLANTGLEMIHQVESTELNGTILHFRQQVFSTKLQNPLFKIAIRRGLLPDPRDRSGKVTAEVNLIQIGACWFVTVPGELLPKLGLSIKRAMRAAGANVTGIIGLANDELGYILPREDFRYPLNPLNPKDHYEETMSISKKMGPNLMCAVDLLLEGSA